MKTTPQELAMIAATLAAAHPDKTSFDLALKARDLVDSCEFVLASKESGEAYQRQQAKDIEAQKSKEIVNAPNVPFDSLLAQLMPNKDTAEQTAKYRHFMEWEAQKQIRESGVNSIGDVGNWIAVQKANGVLAGIANATKHDFKIWNAVEISKNRAQIGSKGGKSKRSKKAIDPV